MLLPEPMSRILVIGTRKRLPDAIDLLYGLENVHVIDFETGEEGFTLGAPLPEASDASRKLLKLRSAEKDLEIDADSYSGAVPVSQVRSELDVSIAKLDDEVMVALESRNAKQLRLSEAQSRLAQLEPYRSIPLDVEMYRGYDNLEVLAGNVRSDPEPALEKALGGQYEMFAAKGGSFVVLFVSAKHVEEAQRILAESGFIEVPLPLAWGFPETRPLRSTTRSRRPRKNWTSPTRRSPGSTRATLPPSLRPMSI